MTSMNRMAAAPVFVVSETLNVLVWVMGDLVTLTHIAAAAFAKEVPTGLSAPARLMVKLVILKNLKDVAAVFVLSQPSSVLPALK